MKLPYDLAITHLFQQNENLFSHTNLYTMSIEALFITAPIWNNADDLQQVNG